MSGSKKSTGRSPVERMIVWGGIGILGIVLAVEAYGELTYQKCCTAIQKAMEDTGDTKTLTEADVPALFGGMKPAEEKILPEMLSNRAKKYSKYAWPGILKSRVLYVYYGIEDLSKAPRDVVAFGPELETKTMMQSIVLPTKERAKEDLRGPNSGGGFGGGAPGGAEDEPATEGKAEETPAGTATDSTGEKSAEKPAAEEPAAKTTEPAPTAEPAAPAAEPTTPPAEPTTPPAEPTTPPAGEAPAGEAPPAVSPPSGG